MAVRRPGCFLCREEAADLSSLKPRLDELGVPLYAVVKEQVKNEVKDFQPYFKGEIFLDEEGILLEHREKEFGDKVNPVSVLEAVRKIKPHTSASEKK
uniref:Peroxiredoxin-like 2A n=1 Tax=Sus scrofa TaxID=9823 RepID=A0A8W4FK04_PIG